MKSAILKMFVKSYNSKLSIYKVVKDFTHSRQSYLDFRGFKTSRNYIVFIAMKPK